MSSSDGDSTINSLRLQQFAPWLGSTIRKSALEEIYQHLNLTIRSIFLYRVRDGHIELLEKPGFRVRETFHDSTKPEPEGAFIYLEEHIRANLYRDFFARILSESNRAIDMLLAVDVSDAPITNAGGPVFAFQKLIGSNTVLIPDIDFLHANFYIPNEYRDDIPYASKKPSAVFAGSTTGGRTITADDVKGLTIPRLRAGVFFKGSDQVDFRVPRIVQCASPDVVNMIAGLGNGGDPYSWQDQFKYRFILSIDGNGATCSRMAVGLLSQSVLAKYDSPQLLYYFGALVPWRHYIPISRDDDVLSVVELERRYPMMFARLAQEGRHFAIQYLCRASVCDYTTELLSLFQACLSDAPARGIFVSTENVTGYKEPLIELGAHVQDIGDVWGWPGQWVGEIGSGKAIEAIAIVPTGIPTEAITYRTLLHDGSLSNVAEFGSFCGTRGCGKPLRGFQLQVSDAWNEMLKCTYSGHFTDGTKVGPLRADEVLVAPSGAALEAFYVSVEECDSTSDDDKP